MKLVIRIVGVLGVALGVFALAGVMATWAPDRPVARLSQQWALPPSQFVLVNGMQVHALPLPYLGKPDGYVGLRVNHNLDVQISGFTVTPVKK